jgi:hypothetical protein
MDELELVDVVQCPTCDGWFEGDGPFGLIPHIINEHPQSEQARSIGLIIKEDDCS